MALTVLGLDCSKWQAKMDWPQAKSAGANFAYIRAGSIDNVTGQCYKDYQFDRNSELAPGVMPVWYYWYARLNHDPLKQADYFCELANGKRGRGMIVDIEERGDAFSLKKMLFRIVENMQVETLIYTNENTWKYLLTGDKSWGWQFNLMQADYDSYPTWLEPWKSVKRPIVCHQYTCTGDGKKFGAESRSIDLNFADPEWLGTSVVVQPPPAETFPYQATVSVDNTNIRRKPIIEPQYDFGNLHRNRKLTVVGEEGEWAIVQGYVWKKNLSKI